MLTSCPLPWGSIRDTWSRLEEPGTGGRNRAGADAGEGRGTREWKMCRKVGPEGKDPVDKGERKDRTRGGLARV
ncbi:hypothetical protein Pmani_024573 [Petrolisthes manimaculis]|uniref:Uncharacterized protein n=1 Tax=Petrolisthes manimaculis TaxID=1843537 RepID=A0AAE1U245_9EUCA|nr:hypothetical protein Pmani_024573 [Petrolisthes manimaculis]